MLIYIYGWSQTVVARKTLFTNSIMVQGQEHLKVKLLFVTEMDQFT